MEQHGINTQQFKIAATAEEAERAARELGELGLRIVNHFFGSEENKALSEPSYISRPILYPTFFSLSLSFLASLPSLTLPHHSSQQLSICTDLLCE